MTNKRTLRNALALATLAAAALAQLSLPQPANAAPNGRIAYVVGLGSCDGIGNCTSAVNTVGPRGDARRRLRCSRGPRRRCHDGYVAYSPDGRRLATATSGRLRDRISLRSPRGRLFGTFSFRSALTDFDWSPDGRRFAVSDSDRIWIVKRGRQTTTRLYRRRGGPALAWSSQGRLVWVDDQTGTLRVTDRHLRNVRSYRRLASNPDWSPGGQRLAFKHPFMDTLWVMNADGTGARSLHDRWTTTSEAPITPPRSPGHQTAVRSPAARRTAI